MGLLGKLSLFVSERSDPSPFGDSLPDARVDGDTDGDNSAAKLKVERGGK